MRKTATATPPTLTKCMKIARFKRSLRQISERIRKLRIDKFAISDR